MESIDYERRLRAAQSKIENPHPYYLNRAQHKHSEPEREWILRTLIEPYHAEILGNGRELYWGSVPEVENWLLVIVQDGQLFNAYLNRKRRRDWGRPS
jgi:hypothetical protein